MQDIPPGGMPPAGGLGGGGPLMGAPIAPGPGREVGNEVGGPCCGGPPVQTITCTHQYKDALAISGIKMQNNTDDLNAFSLVHL